MDESTIFTKQIDNKSYNRQNGKHKKQDFGNLDCTNHDAAKTKNGRHNGNAEKNNGVAQHRFLLGGLDIKIHRWQLCVRLAKSWQAMAHKRHCSAQSAQLAILCLLHSVAHFSQISAHNAAIFSAKIDSRAISRDANKHMSAQLLQMLTQPPPD